MSTERAQPLDLPLSQSILDDIPLPFHVYRADRLLVATNRRADQFWGIPREELVNKFNAFENPQLITPNFIENFREAVSGQVVVAAPALVDTTRLDVERKHDVQRWVGAVYFPFHDETKTVSHVVIMNIDFTDMIEREQIAKIVSKIDEHQPGRVATPVIQIWDGILAVPLTSKIDSRQAMAITKNLLEAIVRNQTRVVILDITGVPIDTAVVHYLLSVERACRLLGSEVALTGVSTSAMQTIGEVGADSSKLVIKTNLRSGVAWAFDRLGYRVVRNQRSASPGRPC